MRTQSYLKNRYEDKKQKRDRRYAVFDALFSAVGPTASGLTFVYVHVWACLCELS